MTVRVIGAGLAGCEAALFLASTGVKVELYEQRPLHFSPAHKTEGFAELVCSNSLKADRLDSASGLLKAEMDLMGSSLLPAARKSRVAAGGALAVDRVLFSEEVTRLVKAHPLIEVCCQEVTEVPRTGYTIVATGPLTEGALAADIAALTGQKSLSFYDAAAPIITAESIDFSRVFAASRYDRGEADYVNCPFNKEGYEAFYEALIGAERAKLEAFEEEGFAVYEGCMPVEVMARRGLDTLRFGPMRPVGLRDPATGHRPWANVQLRRENAEGTLYNLVGFQTNLKFAEQKRVFGMIPGLANAEFVRYGVMHRNSFLNSPDVLDLTLHLKQFPNLYFAGQLIGTEGYVESAAGGLLAARFLLSALRGEAPRIPPENTMCGALLRHVVTPAKDFQPMGANMGILPPLDPPERDKRLRYQKLSERALASFKTIL